jgi:hypothetical protein
MSAIQREPNPPVVEFAFIVEFLHVNYRNRAPVRYRVRGRSRQVRVSVFGMLAAGYAASVSSNPSGDGR